MMRVLWFTNIPMPAVDRRTGRTTAGSGHWMSQLLLALRSVPGIELGVATAYPSLPDLQFDEDGVEYFVVGQGRFTSHFGCSRSDLVACRHVVERFDPDLVHVHGSERFFGLLRARGLIDRPTVVSLQGLLSVATRDFYGALTVTDRLAAHRAAEVLTGRGLFWERRAFLRGARREAEILGGVDAVLGRTDWDRVQAAAIAPGTPWYRVGEVLRPEFAAARWSLSRCRRGRVVVTNAGQPYRGLETLLDATVAIARRHPGLEIDVAGGLSDRSGYGRLLRRRIGRLAVPGRVRLLGFQDAQSLARILTGAHAYVLPSFVENSSNSLCEAQTVGVPCVAAAAGGTPSLVDDGRTGLLYPAGDAEALAEQLGRVLGDDLLATRLGSAGRGEALLRHARRRVVGELLSAYRSILGRSAEDDGVMEGMEVPA
jgi:glycosyltransferase involved in cell wall biosynthesis